MTNEEEQSLHCPAVLRGLLAQFAAPGFTLLTLFGLQDPS